MTIELFSISGSMISTFLLIQTVQICCSSYRHDPGAKSLVLPGLEIPSLQLSTFHMMILVEILGVFNSLMDAPTASFSEAN